MIPTKVFHRGTSGGVDGFIMMNLHRMYHGNDWDTHKQIDITAPACLPLALQIRNPYAQNVGHSSILNTTVTFR